MMFLIVSRLVFCQADEPQTCDVAPTPGKSNFAHRNSAGRPAGSHGDCESGRGPIVNVQDATVDSAGCVCSTLHGRNDSPMPSPKKKKVACRMSQFCQTLSVKCNGFCDAYPPANPRKIRKTTEYLKLKLKDYLSIKNSAKNRFDLSGFLPGWIFCADCQMVSHPATDRPLFCQATGSPPPAPPRARPAAHVPPARRDGCPPRPGCRPRRVVMSKTVR